MSLNIVILAAGQGSRMYSQTPKVLHRLGGKTLLEHVIHTSQQLHPHRILVVHGQGSEQVQAHCVALPLTWIRQEAQLGTGHAVQQALPYCSEGLVLILYGDVPLVSSQTMTEIIKKAQQGDIALLTMMMEDPSGLGRIFRNEQGEVVGIIEDKDATPAQARIQEVNTGIVCLSSALLHRYLPQLRNDNSQAEYYLTDVIHLAASEGVHIETQQTCEPQEALGVNTKWQLAMMEREYQKQKAKALAESGVTLMDPERLDIRGDVVLARDVHVDINVILEGQVEVGKNSKIGPNVLIKDSKIGENVEIRANCVIEGAVVEDHCVIGPFAHLRTGSHLKAKSKVGNFVEMKKSVLGEGSKANHLSYLGDTTVGAGVNIGAGTITCNYDGVNKHPTRIEDHVFVGSNTALVAPVVVHEGATIGAGSVITQDVPAHQLAVGRAKQQMIKGWKRPKKDTHD